MPNALEFKGNIDQITRLKINTTDISAIDKVLKEKKRVAPLMMVGLQVVVDLAECNSGEIDIQKIKSCLMNEGVMPVAVMSNDFSIAKSCLDNKLGFIPPYQREEGITPVLVEEDDQNVEEKKVETEIDSTENSNELTKQTEKNVVITRQIRSGQRVYSKGDLTIVGSVSAGAEVIADGNVHIYGALRGRAVAGASGDEGASVFCQKFSGELISIAGFYIAAVDVDPQYHGIKVQISLNEEKIRFYRL